MEFMVRTKEGAVEGPLDQETLKKWVELDKVFADTPIRNAMLSSWKEARDIDFLKDLLHAQTSRLEAEVEANMGFLDRTLELIGFGNDALKRKKALLKEKSTAFKYEYLPNPASPALRVLAALFDLILLGSVALLIFFMGVSTVYSKALITSSRNAAESQEARNASDIVINAKLAAPKEQPKDKKAETAPKKDAAGKSAKEEAKESAPPTDAAPAPTPEPKAEVAEQYAPGIHDDSTLGCRLGTIWTDKSVGGGVVYACIRPDEGNALWCERDFMNSTFHMLFALFAAITLLYYGIALGVFAQTFGMWFWGIFIAKTEGLEEAYPLRAYVFGILSVLIGFLTPVLCYVTPGRRSLHDLITGVRVIRISARPKS